MRESESFGLGAIGIGNGERIPADRELVVGAKGLEFDLVRSRKAVDGSKMDSAGAGGRIDKGPAAGAEGQRWLDRGGADGARIVKVRVARLAMSKEVGAPE